MDDSAQLAEGQARPDISDDIEKDINIEVQITGNTGCTVEHNSQISINYYNLEHDSTDGASQSSHPGAISYLTHLPAAYVAALETLRAQKRCTRDELAKIAFGEMLRRSGIPAPTLRTERGVSRVRSVPAGAPRRRHVAVNSEPPLRRPAGAPPS
jgi:hypothetical protein